jgi:hypothetical protein
MSNIKLECLRDPVAMHGAFMVLIEGSHAHFIAGGHKVNPKDAFSELEFGIGESAWLDFNDADLPTWHWLFQQTVANSVCTAPADQIFTVQALQHKIETARLSTVTGSPHLSFYAGVPLRSKGGQTIGIFFVVNTIERPPLSTSEANFLTSVGTKCVEVLDRAREQSFHNRWTIMQEQLEVFTHSHSLRCQMLEEPQTYAGRRPSTTKTNDKEREQVDPDTISQGALVQSVIPEMEGTEAGRLVRPKITHNKLVARYDNTHNALTLTAKAGKDDERDERTEETVYRKVFRRAAQCLQYALEADGVLFADGLIGFHGEIQPTAEPELELLGEFTRPPWKDSDACEENSQSNSRTYTSAEYLKGFHVDRPAEIFGIAGRSDELKLSPTSKSSVGLSEVDDGFLERLMDRHPAGAIWYFTDSSIMQVKEGKLSKVGLQEEMIRLRSTFPNIKQLMYVPLTDPTSAKRLCACFVWRNQTSPVFTGAADLGSLKVFLHVVESEIGRYDTAAVAKQKETFVSSVSHELSKSCHGFQLLAH